MRAIASEGSLLLHSVSFCLLVFSDAHHGASSPKSPRSPRRVAHCGVGVPGCTESSQVVLPGSHARMTRASKFNLHSSACVSHSSVVLHFFFYSGDPSRHLSHACAATTRALSMSHVSRAEPGGRRFTVHAGGLMTRDRFICARGATPAATSDVL